jgi:iron complex outermembrane receptor protein
MISTSTRPIKEGCKSGGIDNSALPSHSLQGPDFSSLYYDSETGKGGEVGMKGSFMDGTMRVNAAVFYYDYEDLQVQTFNANTIQFETSNAGELNTQGFEVDAIWSTPVEGLSLRLHRLSGNLSQSGAGIWSTGHRVRARF